MLDPHIDEAGGAQVAQITLLLLIQPLHALTFAAAQPVSQLRPVGYVNDFADVLDAGTIAQLESTCQQIDQKAHAQIAVVTIQSLDGSDIESYAVDLFKQWGIGNKASNRGVLILLATQDRHYRIEVGYGLEPILPDGKVGGIGREAVPLLKQGDYKGAVVLMTSRVAALPDCPGSAASSGCHGAAATISVGAANISSRCWIMCTKK